MFIQTGGTFDKDYPKTTQGYAFEITEPAAKRILEKAKPSLVFRIQSILKKDSQDITDADRQQIANAVKATPETRIVVTHGSDALLETAAFLAKRVPGKTIVLTSALLPEKFRDSDAAFNLGMAVGAVQSLPAGIHVAFSGLVLRRLTK
ncbi:MAG: asparaginase domain-containing protein [Candidatus Micrarchaeota archaeon]|nr:asparaginase domain-containing protein [Candidatus Micrarchaeota archaeon]